MLRLLIPFTAGIFGGQFFAIPAATGWRILITGCIMLLAFPLLSVYRRFRQKWLTGFAVHMMFFATGVVAFALQDIRNDGYNWQRYYAPGDGIILSADEAPKEKKNSWTVTATVHYIIRNERRKAVRGKLLLYFGKEAAGKVAAPGPVRPGGGAFLLVRAAPRSVLPSGNPGAFDYRQYLYTQGITMQVYLKSADYRILPVQPHGIIAPAMERIRQWVLSVFRRYIPDDDARGMAEALLIGYKDDLDRELIRTYSNTGVVHIIAISGLHLGLIYALLVLLCRPFRRIKWLRGLLIIGGLWAFSILAGAQPSVLRSALMFSFIVLGELAGRQGTAMNSLCSSAFLLLCIDPWWLWDAGFLLSYAAVLSIMLYQRPLAHLFYIRNKLSAFIWQLNSVTLAAQLLTIPVTVYFFHQFPVYFMLTNLLAVPVSSLIVMAEIGLLACSGIPVLGNWMGTLITALIRIMNTWVRNLEHMPFSAWTGLQLSLPQAVCLLTLIVLLARWLMEQDRRSLFSALAASLILTCLRTDSFYTAGRQQWLIVYAHNKNRLVEIIHGRDAYYMGSLTTPDTLNLYAGLLQPAHIHYRIRRWIRIGGEGTGMNIRAGNHIICIPAGEKWDPPGGQMFEVLLLSRSCQRIPEQVRANWVVADGTLTGKALQRIREDCEKRGLAFYSIREQGAFVMNLP